MSGSDSNSSNNNLSKDGLLLWQLHGLGELSTTGYSSARSALPQVVPPQPILTPDSLEVEAAALFTVLVNLVKSAGHALSLNSLSEGLLAKTGQSWGSKWEKRHGPLRTFLASRAVDGVHFLARNRWFGLQNMAVPNAQDDAILLAPVPRPVPALLPSPPPFQVSGQMTTLNSISPRPEIIPTTALVSWDPFSSRDDPFSEPLPLSLVTPPSSYCPQEQQLQQQQQQQRTRTEIERLRLEARRVEDDALLRLQKEREIKRRADLQAEEEEVRVRMARQNQEDEDQKLACAIAQEEHERTFSGNSAVNIDQSHRLELSAFSASGSGRTSQSRYNSLYADESPGRDSRRSSPQPFTANPGASSTQNPSQLALNRSAFESFGSMSSSSMSQNRTLSSSLSARQQHYRDRSGGVDDQQTLSSYGGGSTSFTSRSSPIGIDDDSSLLWSDFDLLFRPVLLSGFVLTKHDRSGASRKRRFYCDTDLIALRWSSSRLSDVFFSSERTIDLSSIIGVVEGISTDLLKKKLNDGEIFGGHAERFFSLILPSRTLDLEASSSTQAKVLARAFRFLSNARNRAGISPTALVAARRGSARF